MKTYELKNKTEDEVLLQPIYNHLMSTPRAKSAVEVEKLLAAYNTWLKVPEDKLQIIKDIMNYFNYSFLITEDLPNELKMYDEDKQRTHEVFGIAFTLNSITYAECVAFTKIYDLDQPDVLDLMIRRLIDSQVAIGKILNWSECITCPTEQEYLQMCIDLRKVIFLGALELMNAVSANKLGPDFRKVAGILGQLFQLRDDYINLTSQDYFWTPNCITESKFRFPAIHAVQNKLDKGHILTMFRQKASSEVVRGYLTKLLQRIGSMDYTKKVMKKLLAELEEELKKFDENPALLDFARKLCKV